MKGQKNISEIQMWKRDQSEGILERRGRKRLRKRKEEDLRHVIEECEITGGPKDTQKILNETGEGLIELKAITEKRRAIQDGEERQEGSNARRLKPKSCYSFRDRIIKGVQYNRVDKRGGRYIRSKISKRDVKPKARSKPKDTD